MKSKPIFGSRKSLFSPIFGYIFSISLYWKILISAIPSRTQTQISRARNWVFTFHKKRWLRIENLFHINSACNFGPWHPYRLKASKMPFLAVFGDFLPISLGKGSEIFVGVQKFFFSKIWLKVVSDPLIWNPLIIWAYYALFSCNVQKVVFPYFPI